MGFLGPEKYISSELDLKLDPRSNYETTEGKFCTSHPKVFAAGGISSFFLVLDYEKRNKLNKYKRKFLLQIVEEVSRWLCGVLQKVVWQLVKSINS